MAQDLLKLDGRVVIVAGAAGGGIGTTVTQTVARAGATVIAVSRSQAKLDEHVAPFVKEGLSVVPVAADIATDEGIATAMEQARRAPGELYGLVNVAGDAPPATWMRGTRVTRADWRQLFTQNLETMFFMSQAVASELRDKKRPGSIVSISSISGLNTAPYHIAYGTAKAAIVAATRTLAAELALDNIRFNAIAPGPTATPGARRFIEDDPERDAKAISMGRRGTPEEQANAILFFLSELSSYITGQTILVDGGLNLRWTHLDAENVSLFLKDPNFINMIKR
jgi:NAD(P)-dependent dehydrogenase (short-subunit alcohol dehydrogenase family)